MSIESEIRKWGLEHFDRVAFTSAVRPLTYEAYENWISAGRQGSMEYLKRHLEKKGDPRLLLEGARSWILFARNYDTDEPLSVELAETMTSQEQGWIARYARGPDYHEVIGQKHRELIARLEGKFPGEKFLSCVDTKAVMERDAGARAGLGWVGKNTCLIDREHGSFFFVSEILTTLRLEEDKPVADHCGTCTRCLDACPTGALVSPRVLDATRCISYWTIESKQPAPQELAAKFGGHVFGCDICQDVCPWNQKARRQNNLPEMKSSGLVDLNDLISKSDEQIKYEFKDTALSRAKPAHLRQNAVTALENLRKIKG